MKAVVTGGAGFIGSHLTERLYEDEYAVRVVDNLETGKRSNLEGTCVEIIEGDLRKQSDVTEAISGADRVFHLAADTSVVRSTEEPSRTASTNCLGTANVLEAARDEGVDDIVVASSAAVYGESEPPISEDEPLEPSSPYGLSKRWTESLALQFGELYGMDVVALRYFNVYGPRQAPDGEYAAVIPKFTRLMLDGERPVIYGDGEQTRDFVYVSDVVDATVRAAEADVSGKVYNIGSGEPTSVNRLVDVLNEVVGTKIEPRYSEPREGEIRHSYADVSKAHDELGFVAETDIGSGLRRTVNGLS